MEGAPGSGLPAGSLPLPLLLLPLSPQHQASVGLCVCQMATCYVSGDNRY